MDKDLMELVRGIFYIYLDSLSLGQSKLFRSLAPNADDTMTLMVDYNSVCVSPL